eukprot:1325274-Amorphochlora_amoeboformis.AAC.1
MSAIVSKLPRLNRNVLEYIIHFVTKIAQPRYVKVNKMTVSNLAVVFSPSFMRNPSTDPLEMIANMKHQVGQQ